MICRRVGVGEVMWFVWRFYSECAGVSKIRKTAYSANTLRARLFGGAGAVMCLR
jgi:hypothetical protein